MDSVLVARPRLLEVLDTAPGRVLLTAPAGYGKSALLDQWVLTREGESIRISGTAVTAPTLDRIRELLDPGADRAATVIVDDVHHCPAEVLAQLLDVPLPTAARLVLAGRFVPHDALVRARMRRTITEVDALALAMSDAEIAEALPDLDPGALTSLRELTAGWPAGIRLASLAWREGADPRAFDGRDQLVSDYLRHDAFAEADAEALLALRALSGFEIVDADLAREVADIPESTFARIAGGPWYLNRLHRSSHRYTWVPLVRQSLAYETESANPSAFRERLARGAAWAERDPDRAVEAIALHIRAGQPAAALPILREALIPLFASGQLFGVVGLIHTVGAADVTSVSLATMLAYAGVMTSDLFCANEWTDVADQLRLRDGFADTDEEVAFLTLRAHLSPLGLQQMRADVERARSIVSRQSPWRVPALMLAGIVAAIADDNDAATLLEEAVHAAAEAKVPPAQMLAAAERAHIAVTHEDPRAGELVEAAVALADDEQWAVYPHSALAFALRARVLAKAGKIDAALADLQRAAGLRPLIGPTLPWLGIQLRVCLGEAAELLDERELAHVLRWEAEELAGRLRDADHLLPPRAAAEPAGHVITAAERRVLPYLSTHLSYEDIGKRLFVSRNTVKSHVASVYRKLGARSRTEAVSIAMGLGLFDLATGNGVPLPEHVGVIPLNDRPHP